jgi:hypothetical protein
MLTPRSSDRSERPRCDLSMAVIASL